jgi:hypothetical protein
MTGDAQMLYVMLALPTLFGLTLVGEGLFKMSHYESGWINVVMGAVFLAVVAFGYFYLREIVR